MGTSAQWCQLPFDGTITLHLPQLAPTAGLSAAMAPRSAHTTAHIGSTAQLTLGADAPAALRGTRVVTMPS